MGKKFITLHDLDGFFWVLATLGLTSYGGAVDARNELVDRLWSRGEFGREGLW